jgi:hypothetical protein
VGWTISCLILIGLFLEVHHRPQREQEPLVGGVEEEPLVSGVAESNTPQRDMIVYPTSPLP